jgi:hypothetical protein
LSLPEDIGQPADGEPDYMAPSISAKLTDFQLAWLSTQSLELKTSRAQILGGVVSNKFALRFFDKTTKKVGNMLEADDKERRLRQ